MFGEYVFSGSIIDFPKSSFVIEGINKLFAKTCKICIFNEKASMPNISCGSCVTALDM